MADYVFKLSLPYSLIPSEFVDSAKPRESLVRIGQMFRRVASGGIPGASTVVVDAGTSGATAASGTVTFATLIANDTVTVGAQTFTAKASPSGANEFALGASDAAAATNLAAKVNAHTSLAGVVTAAAADEVVTFTAAIPGLIGNAIRLASSDGATAAVSGATLASGATTRTTFSF